MKITIKNKEVKKLEVGDFLIVSDTDMKQEIRQIIKFREYYFGFDIENLDYGLCNESIEDLYKEYIKTYDNVTIVKNSDVEMIIGGK